MNTHLKFKSVDQIKSNRNDDTDVMKLECTDGVVYGSDIETK